MAKILIASPHEGERYRMVDVLKSDDHMCNACADGKSAQEVLANDLPDLVIADVDLPGLDAFELVRLLEDLSEGGGIPLIVGHSGLAEAVDEVSSMSFTWMGLSANSEDLLEMVRARLALGPTLAVMGKVLVIDDDPNLRNALARRLDVAGYTVIEAGDGEEGVERLGEGVDLVMTDIDMPRLDGFEFLIRMRAEPRYRDVPVIVMTAQAGRAEDAARGLELGANDYVRKPFEWSELLARVQTQLRVRESHRLSVEKQRDLAIIELAGAAAHEINNPLAVIVARLELMRERMESDNTLYEDVQKVSDLVDRIAEIVQKMSQVRRYQVRHYCGGMNIIDLDRASEE
ncbi:MAG: response regulator [Candidatus Latescibacteria bacterium]|nr:response regulator [Candidatus Latescibacterota bacterium]